MPLEEIVARLGLALLLGGIIGAERQWRSHYVGLRTNALVSIGSGSLMIFVSMLPSGDPTAVGRMASQVITGIGFLCGGVIFHEGITGKGFNTAATLWCSTAVGMFSGMGFFIQAVILAAFIFMVNLFLRPLVNYINKEAISEDPQSTNDSIE